MPQAADTDLTAAFRDLHGARLHGFALLVSLGEPGLSDRVAAEALEAGSQQAATLRHPERAAAWLRARALRGLHQGAGRGQATRASMGKATLAPLGVDDALYDALAALNLEARAALVTSAVERLDAIDTETILGTSPAAARRVIARARSRYLEIVDGQPPAKPGAAPEDDKGGLIATRVQEVATRAMSPTWRSS